MKLKIPSKNYGVTELYDAIAIAMGYSDVSKLNYDCREINVARNIQDGFFEHYKETVPHASESEIKMSVSMILLKYGPKTDDALEDYEVEVSNKFIC